MRQAIIALLRSKGGKANCFDENGRRVGRGNGDLNDWNTKGEESVLCTVKIFMLNIVFIFVHNMDFYLSRLCSILIV